MTKAPEKGRNARGAQNWILLQPTAMSTVSCDHIISDIDLRMVAGILADMRDPCACVCVCVCSRKCFTDILLFPVGLLGHLQFYLSQLGKNNAVYSAHIDHLAMWAEYGSTGNTKKI